MSRVMPYQPMRPATPEVPVSRMQEILARNAHANAEAPEKEPLKWQHPVKTGAHGQGYMLSECGKFSVTKDMHELGFSYSGWDIRPKLLNRDQMAKHLGVRRSKDEAIALCEVAR